MRNRECNRVRDRVENEALAFQLIDVMTDVPRSVEESELAYERLCAMKGVTRALQAARLKKSPAGQLMIDCVLEAHGHEVL